MSAFDPGAEFDRQVETLLARGYASHAGRTAEEFRALLAALRPVAVHRAVGLAAPQAERVPFVIVPTPAMIGTETAMGLTELRGRPGFTDLRPHEARTFAALADLAVPAAAAYLLVDVERGSAFRDITPDDARAAILAAGRTPLSIEEGIALVTQHPACLERNHCFSLAGSRAGDRRVPAIWISKGAPRLGWCWAGNPHSWLGTASAGARFDAPTLQLRDRIGRASTHPAA